MSNDEVTKRMGQLLRKGAALLNLACPECNTPLLRLKDNRMFCVKCDKEVVRQTPPTSRKTRRTSSDDVLNQLATTVLTNLRILTQGLPEKPHPEEIRAFASTAKDLIDILLGIRNLQG